MSASLRIIPVLQDGLRGRRVSRLLPLFLFLALCRGTATPGREIKLRLFRNLAPAEMRLSGTGEAERIQAATLKEPREAAAGSRIQVSGHELTIRHPLRIEAAGGRLLLTIRMPLEAYVAAAMAGEISYRAPGETLKAMAVVARTYAVRNAGRHAREGFDFCDTTHCQDSRLALDAGSLRAAVQSTEGEMLWFEGSPAATFYSQNCGGMGEPAWRVWPGARFPYLQEHPDGFCPRLEWQSAIPKSELADFAILARTPTGRAERVRVNGKVQPAADFRFSVGQRLGWNLIRSEFYEVRDAGDRWEFRGKGAGHGVGLCQAGALRMGAEGRAYRQILETYFPGTRLGVGAQGFSWSTLGGERVEVWSTQPQADRELAATADRAAREAEERAGWRMAGRAQVRVYPSVEAFRDATGEPGWMAASTRARVIRLQPAGRNLNTLRHEFLHVLIEQRARPGTPLWFREGVTAWLNKGNEGRNPDRTPRVTPPVERAFLAARSQSQLQAVYQAAARVVELLVERFGREALLSWMERGIPPQAVRAVTPATASTSQ